MRAPPVYAAVPGGRDEKLSNSAFIQHMMSADGKEDRHTGYEVEVRSNGHLDIAHQIDDIDPSETDLHVDGFTGYVYRGL